MPWRRDRMRQHQQAHHDTIHETLTGRYTEDVGSCQNCDEAIYRRFDIDNDDDSIFHVSDGSRQCRGRPEKFATRREDA